MDQKYLSIKFAFGMELPNCYISHQIFAHITVADSRKRIKLLFFLSKVKLCQKVNYILRTTVEFTSVLKNLGSIHLLYKYYIMQWWHKIQILIMCDFHW